MSPAQINGPVALLVSKLPTRLRMGCERQPMNTATMVVAFLSAAVAMAQGQKASVLSLDDAVALALKGNRQLQSAALDVNRAQEASAAAKTNRLPQFQAYVLGGEALRQISFTIPQGALGFYPATGPIPAKNSNVTTPQQFTAFIFAQASQPVSQLWKVHLSLVSSQ